MVCHHLSQHHLIWEIYFFATLTILNTVINCGFLSVKECDLCPRAVHVHIHMPSPESQALSSFIHSPLLAQLREDICQSSSSGTSEDKDACAERLLTACRTVLEAQAGPAARNAAIRSASHEESLVLAWLTLKRARAREYRLCDWEIERMAKIARETWALFELVRGIVDQSTLGFVVLTQDFNTFQRVREQAEEMIQAIAPRRLASLLKHPDSFHARLASFLAQRDLSTHEVEARARRVFNQVKNLDSQGVGRLLKKIPNKRLRTYPEHQLCEIAEQFVKWDPLIRFIQDAKLRQRTPWANVELADLLKQTAQDLKRGWSVAIEGYDTEDAVQDAILHVDDYVFEGAFNSWLFTTALNQLRQHWRARHSTEEITDSTFVSSPPTPVCDDYSERLQQFQERYLLVQSFFREPERVKAIWSAMLQYEGKVRGFLSNHVRNRKAQKTGFSEVPTDS